MEFENKRWIKMKPIGVFKFIFLKPLLISLYAYIFFSCISFVWRGFDYGFDTTVDNFRMLFTSVDIIKISIAFLFLAVILMVNNFILWTRYKRKYSKNSPY